MSGVLPLSTAIERAIGVQDRIGEALDGSVLHCRVCDTQSTVSAGDAAIYLRTGWPQCCGETVSLTTKGNA